jgi:hypothetical protein
MNNTSRTPPKLATALLRGLTRAGETLLGDLTEQFESGKSRVWYWRQIAAVIAHTVIRNVQQSPVLVIKAS